MGMRVETSTAGRLRSFFINGVFFFTFSHFFIFFLVVCMHDVFGHHVGTDARCNWYLRDINIFHLLEINITLK
jgi:hypothetical protein